MKEKTKIIRVDLSPHRVNMLLRLFNACYRAGVEEAYLTGDEGACNEAIIQTSQPNVYGSPMRKIRNGSLHWELLLDELAMEVKALSPWREYSEAMEGLGRNFLSPALPLSQDFYNQGMTDYFQCPSFVMSEFRAQPRLRVTPKGLKLINYKTLASMCIGFCYERMDREEGMNVKGALKSFHYGVFIKRFGAYRRYGSA